ncbi:hypothetical protein D3C87_2079390 [compost metagenome]
MMTACQGAVEETEGTPFSSACSETGKVTSVVEAGMMIWTSSLRINSPATSAARLAFDCESRSMISTA